MIDSWLINFVDNSIALMLWTTKRNESKKTDRKWRKGTKKKRKREKKDKHFMFLLHVYHLIWLKNISSACHPIAMLCFQRKFISDYILLKKTHRRHRICSFHLKSPSSTCISIAHFFIIQFNIPQMQTTEWTKKIREIFRKQISLKLYC